jgi:hypothetical protein
MKKLFGLALLALALLAPVNADAACSGGACFWIGGTGTVDGTSDNGEWATTSGGASCSCVPATTDTVTFDANSGGGTVTVNMGGALWTVSSFTMTNFTGTIDFATNSNSLTITGAGGMAAGGAATKTLNLGSGTFTVSNAGANWDTSGAGLTLSAGTSTIAFTASTGTSFQRFFGGSKTYSVVSIGANAEQPMFFSGGGSTIATLTIAAPRVVSFTGAGTYTVTTLTAISGTSSAPVALMTEGNQAGNATISLTNNTTCSWCVFNKMTVSGAGTITATNSMDLANNTGNLSITPPQPGGGGRIIGG